MATMTKADLQWIKKFLDNYEYLVEVYPELFKVEDIDDVKIAMQLIEEKINEQHEDSDDRH